MHVRTSLRLDRLGAAAMVVVALAAAGCTINVVRSGTSDGTQTSGTITVRIVNSTDLPLDPQIYVCLASAGADTLFDAANKRSDFGFAGLGYLEAGRDDTLTVDCADPVLIGTQGGIIGEELGKPTAQGRQSVLEQGRNLECGDLVTFTFTSQGGSLITSVTTTPQGGA